MVKQGFWLLIVAVKLDVQSPIQLVCSPLTSLDEYKCEAVEFCIEPTLPSKNS